MKIIREPLSDTISEDGYRLMYDTMRWRWTLREFVEQTESALSIAYWSKYSHRSASLSIAAKNDLRRGWNKISEDPSPLPELPETPLTLLAALVDDNAGIVQEGEGIADKVVLYAKGAEINRATTRNVAPQRPVAPVTATNDAEDEPAYPRRLRSANSSIDVPAELREELNYLRRERGLTWFQFLDEAKRVMSVCAHSRTTFVVIVDGDQRQEAQICQDCGTVQVLSPVLQIGAENA